MHKKKSKIYYLKFKKDILKNSKEHYKKYIIQKKEDYIIDKIKYTEYLINKGYKIIQIKENKENLYFINDNVDIIKIDGFTKYIKNKKLNHKTVKKTINHYGYQVVSITKEWRVHQLMAITYLNHIPQNHKLVIDHIDGNKLNNKIENLQIVTNWQNLAKGRFDKTQNEKFLKFMDGMQFCTK